MFAVGTINQMNQHEQWSPTPSISLFVFVSLKWIQLEWSIKSDSLLPAIVILG